MLFSLLAASLTAAPAVLYVQQMACDSGKEEEAKLWTQEIAADLRARGFRVTTQAELGQLMSGDKQRQAMGCDDKDCGLDSDILMKADGVISGSAVGESMISLSVRHNTGQFAHRSQPWAIASNVDGYSNASKAFVALIPQLLEKMKAEAEPGQIPECATAASAGKEPGGANVKRTCSATGQATLSGALALWVLFRRRRRS